MISYKDSGVLGTVVTAISDIVVPPASKDSLDGLTATVGPSETMGVSDVVRSISPTKPPILVRVSLNAAESPAAIQALYRQS